MFRHVSHFGRVSGVEWKYDTGNTELTYRIARRLRFGESSANVYGFSAFSLARIDCRVPLERNRKYSVTETRFCRVMRVDDSSDWIRSMSWGLESLTILQCGI